MNEACVDDSECYTNFEFCSPADNICLHKDVTPFLALEIVGCVITALALFYANCGGLGGGGIIIPVTIFFFGFDMKSGIALSNASIAVAAICRYVQNLPKPHPLKNGAGVMVDYNTASIMLPSIVVGVIAGGVVYMSFPELILAIALVILLSLLIISTWIKLCKIQAAEHAEYGPLCGKKVEQPEATENNGQSTK